VKRRVKRRDGTKATARGYLRPKPS
jgi:hypothetical protein